ncbi:hypothetical protein [Undibacterium sp. GrIS 1.8]|uniref:hypothetical protein n=1 Tax=Undibacterium sp. GrIS 1.8 TaxID=3143934 RepID=UPI00339AF1BB
MSCEVAFDFGPNAWQHRTEFGQAVKLGFTSGQSPVGVVAILFAASRITPRGLNMALRLWANPDRGVGRRNRQFLDSCNMFDVA